jgi:hypothetical protein
MMHHHLAGPHTCTPVNGGLALVDIFAGAVGIDGGRRETMGEPAASPIPSGPIQFSAFPVTFRRRWLGTGSCLQAAAPDQRVNFLIFREILEHR